MSNNSLLKIWIVSLAVLAMAVSFEMGLYLSKRDKNLEVNNLVLDSTQKAASLEQALGIKNGELSKLDVALSKELESKNDLQTEIDQLEGKIAGLETSREHPFSVPSEGTVGTFNGTFGGNMNGFRHLGVDIWTSSENNGAISTHKGNAVYSVCNGTVSNIENANAAITIACDPIDKTKYHLPEYKVYTHYAHMGNAETGELYIKVHRGQRVKAGQELGFQGDKSSYFPEMRNVHLHFSVFTGLSETDKSGGALNPCLYIGGDCSRAGVKFER